MGIKTLKILDSYQKEHNIQWILPDRAPAYRHLWEGTLPAQKLYSTEDVPRIWIIIQRSSEEERLGARPTELKVAANILDLEK